MRFVEWWVFESRARAWKLATWVEFEAVRARVEWRGECDSVRVKRISEGWAGMPKCREWGEEGEAQRKRMPRGWVTAA